MKSWVAFKLEQILKNQTAIQATLGRIEENIMAVRQTVEQHAAAVNAFSDQIAAAIEGVRADIASLKQQLADAGTPEEVAALLAPVEAKLQAQADALTALDAENQVVVPPPPPPEEPPL
jgi:archaellum component FlaC